MYQNSCYVILHKDISINKDRTRNLLAVVDNIRSKLNVPILVLEQHSHPNTVLSSQLLEKKVQYQFLYNPGLFNRSWGFNCAVNMTAYTKFILADNDVILNNEDLCIGLNNLDKYDVIKPFRKLYDLKETDTKSYIETKIIPTDFGKERMNLLAGTLMMITRNAFLTVGGYDERFEGWGGEDDEMTLHLWKYIQNQTLSYYSFGGNLLHLYHNRNIYDSNSQPNYKSNYSYIKDGNRNKNTIIGNINKYMNKLYVIFDATHPYWSGKLFLYQDHTFEGGGNKPNGKWSIDGDSNLVLDWYHWSKEVLRSNSAGYYNNNLKLIYAFLNG